jgi:hypothetical protein
MMAGTKRYVATAGGSSLGILLLDLATPPEIIVCLLYAVVLVVTPLTKAQIVAIAVVGTGFTILAGLIEPALGDPALIWFNRALVVACLAGCATLLCWPRANAAFATMRRRLAGEHSPVTQFFDGIRRMGLSARRQTFAPRHVAEPAERSPSTGHGHDGARFVVGTMITLVILDTLADGATGSFRDLCLAVRAADPPGLDSDELVALVRQRLDSLRGANAIERTPDGRWRLINSAGNDNRR